MTITSEKPTVRIENQAFELVTDLLVGMEMTEQEMGFSSLMLRLNNFASTSSGAGFAFEDNSILKLGAKIQVGGGDENQPGEIFQGTISCLEAEFPSRDSAHLVVLAEDALQKARMTRRTKVHPDDATVQDLARLVADELGLQFVPNEFEQSIGARVQLNESNLAFLRRMLARFDGDVQIVGEELHVSPRANVQRGDPVIMEFQTESEDADILSLKCAHVSADLAQQTTEVTVSGWDPEQGQRVTGRSTGANLRGDASQGSTGAQLLEHVNIRRAEHVGHLAITSETEATAIADAAFDCRARKFVCLDGTAQGDPRIRVGATVDVRGLGPRFDNKYYVTTACHRWDRRRGYEVDFEAECAYWGA